MKPLTNLLVFACVLVLVALYLVAWVLVKVVNSVWEVVT